ncbi:MAG: hypothetical protein Q8P80_01060 [Candidatus Levybacteria bacterium]|nr:hypothetical protein [Candidatus Levybacteria bacterium]
MKTEKIVISFIAVVIGILAAGAVFYFYQSSKTIPASKSKTVTIAAPTPTPKLSIFLSVDKPKDEDVVDSKTISVSGKTTGQAAVIVSTQSQDQVLTPASNGSFSTTITIEDGQNQVEITAIAPNGEETRITRTITFSTETF